jgi:hypothetical protein
MWYLFLIFLNLICSILYGVSVTVAENNFQVFCSLFCTIVWAVTAGLNLSMFIDYLKDKRY